MFGCGTQGVKIIAGRVTGSYQCSAGEHLTLVMILTQKVWVSVSGRGGVCHGVTFYYVIAWAIWHSKIKLNQN